MSSAVDYERKALLLSVRGLTKVLGGKTILKDLNLEVHDFVRKDGKAQGQILGVLGPSGVGKTTLFRCLAGHDEPTAGEILLTGQLMPVKVGMVGVVAQNYPLLRWRTVLENLVIAARVRYRERTRKEAIDLSMSALAEYGLADKANAYPAELSGGQQQRVAIAQQLLSSDHFLLLDEPFTGLDPLAKDVACSAVLKASTLDDLNTTIVVTHDIPSAVAISDTIVLIGRTFNEQGQSLGASIVRTYDLIERGLAWNEGIDQMPEFHEMVREIKNDFRVC